MERGQLAARWAHIPVGVDRLRVDARLDRVAARARDRGLLQLEARERVAGGDAELRLHEVDPADLLGHGVLDLEAGVRFDEEEVAVVGFVDEELEGAEAAEVDGLRETYRGGSDRLTDHGGDAGAGRDLDELLVAALHAALALTDVADRAAAVAHDLDFDVARAGDEALDVDGVGAEGAQGLGLAALVRLRDLVGAIDDAHAAATAAGHGLDQHRRALGKAVQELARLLHRDRAFASGDDRHALLLGQRLGRVLSPRSSRASTEGPTKLTPALAQRRANSALSARKP